SHHDRLNAELRHQAVPASFWPCGEPRCTDTAPASSVQTVGQLNIHHVAHAMQDVQEANPGIADAILRHPVEVIIEVVLLIGANDQTWLAPMNQVTAFGLENTPLVLAGKVSGSEWSEETVISREARIHGHAAHITMARVQDVKFAVEIVVENNNIVQL